MLEGHLHDSKLPSWCVNLIKNLRISVCLFVKRLHCNWLDDCIIFPDVLDPEPLALRSETFVPLFSLEAQADLI